MGQVMLFFSLFTFLVGFCIAGITVNLVVKETRQDFSNASTIREVSLHGPGLQSPDSRPSPMQPTSQPSRQSDSNTPTRESAPRSLPLASLNVPEFLVWWLPYLVIGTLLFFSPLLPLRSRMATATREYLLLANSLHLEARQIHESHLHSKQFRSDALQGLVALDILIEKAGAMAIWPYDRKTFLRYAGLLLTPLVPAVADLLVLCVAVPRTAFFAGHPANPPARRAFTHELSRGSSRGTLKSMTNSGQDRLLGVPAPILDQSEGANAGDVLIRPLK